MKHFGYPFIIANAVGNDFETAPQPRFRPNEEVVFFGFEDKSPLRHWNGETAKIVKAFDKAKGHLKLASDCMAQKLLNEYYFQCPKDFDEIDNFFPQTKAAPTEPQGQKIKKWDGSNMWWVKRPIGGLIFVHESNLQTKGQYYSKVYLKQSESWETLNIDNDDVSNLNKKIKSNIKFADLPPDTKFGEFLQARINQNAAGTNQNLNLTKSESKASLASNCSVNKKTCKFDPLRFGGDHTPGGLVSKWNFIQEERYKIPAPRRNDNNHFTGYKK